MGFAKKVLRTGLIQGLIKCTITAYLRLSKTTITWQIESKGIPSEMLENKKPFIIAFWHGRLGMFVHAWRFDNPINIMISEHRDGLLISRAVAPFGINTLAGSSTNGGSAALRKVIRAVQRGEVVGITPDGPQGPRMRAGKGIVEASRLSGAPIIPLALSAKSAFIASSWDRLMLPFPFTKGILLWGRPIYVPKDAGKEKIAKIASALETALNEMTADLDSRLGRNLIQPQNSHSSVR